MTSPIRFLGQNDLPDLDLSQLTIQDRYRDHPHLDKEDHQALYRHDLAAVLHTGGICAAADTAGGTHAICTLAPLPWDSTHFGLPMARLTLTADPSPRQDILLPLVDAVLSAQEGHSHTLHISAELDIDQYELVNTLARYNFEIMDIKREFRWTNLDPIQEPKFLSKVRPYRSDDKPRVMALLDEVSFAGRFYRDATLSHTRTQEMYRLWLEQLLDRANNDTLALVFEADGAIQACGVTERVDLSPAGVDLTFLDKGLYLSSRHPIGGYYPVIYGLAQRALQRYRSVQTSVSLNNHPAVRVLEKMHGGTRTTRMALRRAPNDASGVHG